MGFDLSIVGKTSEPSRFAYTHKDTILYALGVGAKKDELDFLYEKRGPKVIPSFAVVPTFPVMLDALGRSGGDFAMVVHGAQRFRVHKPFAPSGELTSTATIRGIYDLRRFASVLVDTHTKNEKGELVAEGTWTIVYRNAGGFGGDPPPKEPAEITVPKDREPDFRVEEKTTPEQALLYRLSGDPNPLHADPEFAKAVGFEQGPILHGLCTYGFMVRHAAKGACGGDASRLTGFDGRFSKPVWPGETIVTQGWIVAPGKIGLVVSVKEREENVITAASATFA
ncbi:MAG TPA: MaoC/PaaZ C-terminal domain-containing protein [Polyangiaceae bacterium]|jgi:acyl dehydratase